MNLLILIAIVVILLLYAASQVIPIGGILVFAVFVGLAITFDVRYRRRSRKIRDAEEAKQQLKNQTDAAES